MNPSQPERALATGVASLEANLDICQAEIRKALAQADAVEAFDEVDYAYDRAVRFLKLSAKIGLSLAKVRGEHTNNVNVRRTEVSEQEVRVEFPAPERREPDRPPKPLDPATETRLNQIYNDWLKARADKQGDVLVASDEEEEAEEGGPPSNFPRLSLDDK